MYCCRPRGLCVTCTLCTVADQEVCVSRVLLVLFQTKRFVYHVHAVYCCRPRGLCISCPPCTFSDQEVCVLRALCVLLQTERVVYLVSSVYCFRPRGLCITSTLCTVADREGCVSRVLCVLFQTKRAVYHVHSVYCCRPREEDPGQYEQWTEGGWMFMDCNWPVNSGLIWNQDLCRCDWGPNRIIAQPDLNSESDPSLTSTVSLILM